MFYSRTTACKNASFINETTPSSSAKSSGRISRGRCTSSFTLFFIVFLTILAGGAHAQSVPVLQTESNVQASLPAAFGPILQAAEPLMCKSAATLVGEGAVAIAEEDLAPLLAELKVTCENVMWEIEISTGVAEAALVVPFGAGMIALAAADFIACNQIINHFLLPELERAEDSVCSMILSQSTSTTSSSVSSSTSTSTTSASPPAATGSLPQGFGQNVCLSCLLNTYLFSIMQWASTLCGEVATEASAFDLSTFFCNPGLPQYSQFCSTLCANPCTAYSIQAIINGLGPNYFPNPGANPSRLGTICSQCDLNLAPGNFQCSTVPSCLCGLGSQTCAKC
jgi:hypothetical protein